AEVLRGRGHQHHRPRQLCRAHAHRAAVVTERGGHDEPPGLSLCTPAGRTNTMTQFHDRRRLLQWLAALPALAALPPIASPAPATPADSVYRLDANLEDQNGRAITLASLRGSPVIASMFYGSCEMVCPMIFETIHETLKALPAADREPLKVLM